MSNYRTFTTFFLCSCSSGNVSSNLSNLVWVDWSLSGWNDGVSEILRLLLEDEAAEVALWVRLKYGLASNIESLLIRYFGTSGFI